MNHPNNQPTFALLAVPGEVLAEAGIDSGGMVQFTAEQGKITVEQVDPAEADLVCAGNCDTCPLLFRCSGQCGRCPCAAYCEDCSLSPAE